MPQAGGHERADMSKRRAFYTIMAILGALMLRLAWSLFWAVLYVTGGNSDFITMTIDVWFNLPSILVVPLLFVSFCFYSCFFTEQACLCVRLLLNEECIHFMTTTK